MKAVSIDQVPSQQTNIRVLNPPPKLACQVESEPLSLALKKTEIEERNECEKIIRQGWVTFLEVGQALATIRNQRLYRDLYGTFEEYCKQQWEFSKTHANRLIEAAAVAAALTPIGVKLKSESQVRPLVGLPPQKIPAAWKRAEEFAGNGEVTAKAVRKAAEEFKGDSWNRPNTSKLTVSGAGSLTDLKQALKLIDQVEEATKEKKFQKALDALKALEKCLVDLRQV